MTPNISNKAFWDVNFSKINYTAHADDIICRIFDDGYWSDILEIWLYYGTNRIIQSLTNAPYLEQHSIKLASAMFNIKPEKFRCYGKRQFRKTL